MKRIVVTIWDYFRNSWEGDDGKFSYKRACQFVFVWLMVGMVVRGAVQNRWNFYAFLTIAILYALTAAIITIPQLIKMIKYYSKSRTSEQYPSYPDSSEISESVTEKTVETVKPVETPPGDI